MLRDVKWRQSLFYCLILNHCLIVKSKNNRYCLIRFFILLNRSGSRLWAIICPAYRFKYRLYPIKSALTRLQNISILARKELKFILLDPSYKWLNEMTSSFYKDQRTPWITFLKHCKSYAILRCLSNHPDFRIVMKSAFWLENPRKVDFDDHLQWHSIS